MRRYFFTVSKISNGLIRVTPSKGSSLPTSDVVILDLRIASFHTTMGFVFNAVEALTTAAVAYFFINGLLQPSLNDIPGPFLAKFTNLWRLFNVWAGRAELTQLKLHHKFGSAVRLGPDCVSLSDPDLIKTIYSTKQKWAKVGAYLFLRRT